MSSIINLNSARASQANQSISDTSQKLSDQANQKISHSSSSAFKVSLSQGAMEKSGSISVPQKPSSPEGPIGPVPPKG